MAVSGWREQAGVIDCVSWQASQMGLQIGGGVGRGGARAAVIGQAAAADPVFDYEPGNHVICLAPAASLPEIARSSCPLTSS